MFSGDHFVSVLTAIKSAVRSMKELAIENSEKISFLSAQQQKLSVILHELSGTEILSTNSRNPGPGSGSRGQSSGGKRSPGVSPGSAVRNLTPSRSKVPRSKPMLVPVEGEKHYLLLLVDVFYCDL
jgi:hypothetical protein